MKMRIASALLLVTSVTSLSVITTRQLKVNTRIAQSTSTAVDTETGVELDFHSVKSLPFRELQKECKKRGLSAVGSTTALRSRLMEHEGIVVYCKGDDTDEDECIVPSGISFMDESDDGEESKIREIEDSAARGYWKKATRKLKQLRKRGFTVPEEVYVNVLESCVSNRLQGARAAEPARKILEEMAECGYNIPITMANQCILNSIGKGEGGTHDGHGGIDTALAMLAAMESTNTPITLDSYAAVIVALSEEEGSLEEAMLLLRATVVDHAYTPSLSVFADVAAAAAASQKPEAVMQLLTLVKASGYELDTIASAAPGRSILASGVIAAEQLGNLALGLRLLTAAQNAAGCAPDRGDDLVAASSVAAQRASTLIHRRAIDRAVDENNWKLAVKLLALMPQRSLTPSAAVWRRVVTVCAKCEKSRKATSLLLDWVKLYEEGKAERPPLNVFNLVINTCEICNEEELTLVVLDSMKKTHETEGNIITFNIALKRLAKQGNTKACEGIIVSMLKAGVEPNVVSYTTALGACAMTKDSALALEWLLRMKSRNVNPNFHTFNTALAACLDGKLESTIRGSKIATMMKDDIDKEMTGATVENPDYNSVIPDTYTRTLARNLMKQLRDNWRNGDIDMKVAKATVRVPYLKIVDFNATQVVQDDETAIEYASLHKQGRRNIEL